MTDRLRLFLPLLLTLLGAGAAVVNGRDFWSIDCGGTAPFTDFRNITWVDDTLTAPPNGVPHTLPPTTQLFTTFGPSPLPRELSTLRVFPSTTTTKHCYTIPNIGSGRKILVRSSFFYGNYDGKLNPPRFRITFEADDLGKVVIGSNIYNVSVFESYYTTRSNDTSVCVNRLYPGEDPFINSIEVRALPSEMYAAVNGSRQMSALRRSIFGANTTIRYPDDVYDRLWRPGRTAAGQVYSSVPNTAPSVNISSVPEAPPLLAFEHAAVPFGKDAVINISIFNLPSDPVPVYINMYFTEPANLTGTGANIRAFHVLVDGAPITNTSKPIIPEYGKANEIFGLLLVSSNTVFSLVPANGSKLVPVISALEVFWIGDVLTEPTDANDVLALKQLQNQYPVLQQWTGDPCLPSDFTWEWVGCSFNSPPRIAKLLLSGLGLTGPIPDFSPFDALVNIDLHNNSFTGAIPEYLAKLRNVKLLNLADNNFTSIPRGLYQQNSSLMLNVTGNPALCGPNEYCVPSLNLVDAPPPALSPPSPSRNGCSRLKDQGMPWWALWVILLALV